MSSLILTEVATPPAAPAGKVVIFVNTSGVLQLVDDQGNVTTVGGSVQVNADWNATTGPAVIENKPTIPAAATVMGASGSNHAPGLVPDPGNTAGSSRYLREDGTWDTPPGGSSGIALSAFYVAPSGYSGAVPSGYTLVTQSSLVARVVMNAGYNIVEIAVGGAGTVNLVANANPFVVDVVDGDGGLSTVAVNKVLS